MAFTCDIQVMWANYLAEIALTRQWAFAYAALMVGTMFAVGLAASGVGWLWWVARSENNVSDLAEFLGRCLDRDERTARAAMWDLNERWSVWYGKEPYEQPCVIQDHLGDGVVNVQPFSGDVQGVAEHIVRHDPAHVLGDIAVKRAVIANLAQLVDSDLGYGTVRFRAEEALEALANPYADRPGWREEWRIM